MNSIKLNQPSTNDQSSINYHNTSILDQDSAQTKRTQNWSQFIDFMKENPKTLLDLIPSPTS